MLFGKRRWVSGVASWDERNAVAKREREDGTLERRQRRMKIREYLLERYLLCSKFSAPLIAGIGIYCWVGLLNF